MVINLAITNGLRPYASGDKNPRGYRSQRRSGPGYWVPVYGHYRRDTRCKYFPPGNDRDPPDCRSAQGQGAAPCGQSSSATLGGNCRCEPAKPADGHQPELACKAVLNREALDIRNNCADIGVAHIVKSKRRHSRLHTGTVNFYAVSNSTRKLSGRVFAYFARQVWRHGDQALIGLGKILLSLKGLPVTPEASAHTRQPFSFAYDARGRQAIRPAPQGRHKPYIVPHRI